MQLAQLQDAIIADIYNGTQTSAGALVDGHAERLAIFGNNTRLQLTSVLADTFSVLQQLVGEQAFTMLSRAYQQEYPLKTANVYSYGSHLAAFLSTFKPFQEYAYFVDMAALEYAVFQAHLAQDACAVTMEQLQTKLADPGFTLQLHPSVSLVTTNHDVLPIWQAHQSKNDETMELVAEPQAYLVWRDQQHELCLQSVSAAMAALITATQGGLSFAESMAVAMQHLTDQPTDMPILQQAFGALIMNGVFYV